MPENNRRTYVRGTAILGATMVFVKIISAIFRYPVNVILGEAGSGHFLVTYQIYAVLLAVSTSGIPVALSRLISDAASMGRTRQVKRYFSVALAAFTVIGAAVSLLMFLFADSLALLLRDAAAAPGIRMLSPAVLFVCMAAVYEGYAQGQGDMVPTSIKQIAEVLGKVSIGFAAAFWLFSNNYDSPSIAAGAITGTPVGLCVGLLLLVAHKRKFDRRQPANTVVYETDRPDRHRAALKKIVRVSVPIALGASFMTILTLLDTMVVRYRLSTGAGFSQEVVDVLYGVYARGQQFLNMPSVFVVPVTIGLIPVITAALVKNSREKAKRITETALKLTNVLAMPAGLGICVLANPIFNVLYPGSNKSGPTCLAIFGIASYFICLQLMTIAILHANGHERRPMLTFLVGGAAQIAVDYILVGNPKIGIVGSPVGTLVCYFLISALNILFITKKVKSPPQFAKAMVKPAFCSIVMAVAALSVYELLFKVTPSVLGTGYWRIAVCLFTAVLIAAIVYIILIIATKTVTRDDIKLLPRGEKFADFLRMR